MEWILAANHRMYDHINAFNDLPYIDWMQHANFEIGDIVYIYASKPTKKIEFITEVIEVNITSNNHLDDRKYWMDIDNYNKGLNHNRFVRLKPIAKINDTRLSYANLKANGLRSKLQSPKKLFDKDGNLLQFGKYIHDIIDEIHRTNNTWSKFINLAFSNDSFKKYFHQSKVVDRTYYDLFFESKEVHLVARDSTKSLEVYIQNNVSLYHFFVANIDLLSSDIPEKFDIYDKAENKQFVHRKIVIYYTENQSISFNNWLCERALILRKNILSLEKKYNNHIKLHYNIIDNQINEFIANKQDLPPYFAYTDEICLPPKKTEKKGIITYNRDRQKSINALAHAKYKCEVDKEHYCFIRKKSDLPYTEAHHLIPLSCQDKFDYSLDIEENIVSLCSNCHNEIHYGKNAKKLLEKLYNERYQFLKKKGIDITLDELLSLYNL